MPMEKQGTVENQLAHTIDQTEYDSRYDRTAKKLLANKQILAQIMKGCVNEYSDCTVDDIVEKYIEGTPEVGSVGVHVDDTNRPKKSTDVIKGSNNEDSTLTEGTLFYDVRFDAIAPKSADSAEQEEDCSRMISAQHGPIFTKSEYGKIRKVYSIWICTQPSDGFENTLTRYSIKPEQLIGEAQEETENYDLMSVVMIGLGKPGTENHKGILKFMEVLLSSTRSGSEKKKILEEEFGVAMSEELEREVLEVCNLSQGVRAEGREEGRQEGRIEGIGIGEIRMLVQLVREGDLPLERAAAKAKMTVEQFKETMENTPLQAV
mgnify:CR=1 FL=1